MYNQIFSCSLRMAAKEIWKAVAMADHFEKIQKLPDPVPGCPNFRRVPGYKVGAHNCKRKIFGIYCIGCSGLLLWTAHSGGIQGCPGKGTITALQNGWWKIHWIVNR